MINIYKASAGSGKTFTLAREYIKLILGHKGEDGRYVLNKPGSRAGHRAVLAMTFTNKATEEMKSRIIHELAVLAGCERDWNDGSPYEKDLCDAFDCTPQRLGEAAGDAIKGLLYDFNRFSVSTIDSFFQTVLRAFAHEAEVSSNYGLELDDEEVITMSVDQLLQSLNHSRPSQKSHELETWITGYMKSLIDEGNQFTLFNRGGSVQSGLIKFIARIHNDTFKDNEKVILEYLSDSSRYDEFRSAIFNAYKETKEDKEIVSLYNSALGLINQLPDSEKLVMKSVTDMLKGFLNDGWKKILKTGLPSIADKILNDPSKIWKAEAIKKGLVSTDVENAVIAAVIKCRKCLERLTLLNVIKTNIYQLGLLSAVMELMDRFRVENSTLLLSDTNTLLAKIIDGDDSPFLYEKLGVRYHHYLIDEFQDTSISQWANMSPLLKESLAYDYDNLVIGDEKQCIYRFRNSDPSLLHNLHRESWAAERCKVRGDTIEENTNWRSSAEVVRFNNALFTSISHEWGLDDVYSNVEQQVSTKHLDHHGYVKVRFFPPECGDQTDATLRQLGDNVRRQLESGYLPGDIAILVRTAADGNKVINYLESRREEDPTFPHFDIISDKSLLISSSPAVESIISRLRLLSSVETTAERHHKSNREIAGIIDDYQSLFASGNDATSSLEKALARMTAREVSRDDEMSATENQSIHGIDLISLVENIISTHLSADLLDSDNIYITAFVDLVVRYMGQGRADIRSFLQWWDDTGCTTSISGGSDSKALNILTVHKSKGLEFPCVHVPFAEFSTSNRADIAWFEVPEIPGIDPEIIPPMMPLNITSALESTPLAEQFEEIKRERVLDRTNLLYVAFTRAVDELIVGVKISKTDIQSDPKPGVVPSTASTLFHAINSNRNLCGLTLSLDEKLTFTYGSPTLKKGVKHEKGTAMRPSDSVRVGAYTFASKESVWGNTNIELPEPNSIAVARERGVILHGIMSRIRYPEDIDDAFRLFSTTADAELISPADMRTLRDIVHARINDTYVAKWFKDFRKVYLEREVLTTSGRLRRIDRVVHTADGELHVIDYKSGSQNPKRYFRQIREYMDFFRANGYPHVQGFLYYLDSGEVVEVEAES